VLLGLLALLADGNAAVNVERVSGDVVAGGVERQECTHARNLPATSLCASVLSLLLALKKVEKAS